VNIHEKYINRCIQIAKNAIPSSYPNPAVGCCIVHDNKVIGEGYTSEYGSNHAEVNAINSVKNKELLISSSLYVTLEPCSHFGKTPPCSDLILKFKIPKVYIGIEDPNPKVSGNGIKRLKKNGIIVKVGILAEQCKTHHRIFMTNILKKRPYTVLKWAESKDGYIAPIEKKIKKPVWISNEISRQFTHKLRSEFQCILLGSNTIKEDNPKLNTRDYFGKSPTIAVITKKNNLNKNLNIFKSKSKVLVISNDDIDFKKNVAKQVCKYLNSKQISSVIVEGGAITLNTFLKENIWDEIMVYKTNTKLHEGIKAPILKNYKINDNLKILNNKLVTYLNPF
jgi:diaminohydroxyphosphoribosylaminopyrimidine deaminase/5-amino-6-(5-phosphoribosylamino)uracil reductase